MSNYISDVVKFGPNGIQSVRVGDELISKIYFGENLLWQSISGTLNENTVTVQYCDGLLTFSGNGKIPKIAETSTSGGISTTPEVIKELLKVAEDVTEIIIEDSITGIEFGALGCFKYLTKITIPFVGASKLHSTSEKDIIFYPFGYIFGAPEDTKEYYLVNTCGISYRYYPKCKYYLPEALKTVIVRGGQTNSNQLLWNSFAHCRSIEELVISDNITAISGLGGCDSLKALTIPFIGYSGFKLGHNSGTTFGAIFYVDQYLLNNYQYTNSWTINYRNIKGTTIDNYTEPPSWENHEWQPIPKSLTQITVTGYDVPWEAFDRVDRNEGLNYQHMDQIVLKKIKFTSTNPNCPTRYICANAFRTLGEAIPEVRYNPLIAYKSKVSCIIYLPDTLVQIGKNLNSGTGEQDKIYYQGNKNQWENLKITYCEKSDSNETFFKNWQVEYQVLPEDFDDVPIPEDETSV